MLKKINDKYIDVGSQNINALIDGSVMDNQKTITVQDSVKKLIGSVLKQKN